METRTSAAPLAQPPWYAVLVAQISLAKSRLQFALLPQHHQQSHLPPADHKADQDRDAPVKEDPAQLDDDAAEVHRIVRELVRAIHHEMLGGVLHLKRATRGDKMQTKTPNEACPASPDEDESEQIEPPWTPISPSVTDCQPREFLRHGDMCEQKHHRRQDESHPTGKKDAFRWLPLFQMALFIPRDAAHQSQASFE
ncbi:MAG: hypothetical protein E6I80_08725 [Chloroflexi bacterium]|nr:MAG: hypothetical protein E6I80_08725 [Chloroflexota bacterium]